PVLRPADCDPCGASSTATRTNHAVGPTTEFQGEGGRDEPEDCVLEHRALRVEVRRSGHARPRVGTLQDARSPGGEPVVQNLTEASLLLLVGHPRLGQLAALLAEVADLDEGRPQLERAADVADH